MWVHLLEEGIHRFYHLPNAVFIPDTEFPRGSSGKESAYKAGEMSLIPGEGNGNPTGILAWRIPWTEEPGGPQSMGSQRVGHD